MPTPSLIQKVIGGFKHRARYSRPADAVTDRPHAHESLQELRAVTSDNYFFCFGKFSKITKL